MTWKLFRIEKVKHFGVVLNNGLVLKEQVVTQEGLLCWSSKFVYFVLTIVV